ncbi:phosphatidylserine decarboxylase [Jeotgalibacillus proteolyticus]|uniref:phosphatidylserine decarboxylase n=1 Tax=Jeotgalibacillus proteolyticus TaxID=2082395 RepID=A0A2S5G9C5_9BACL|nr:phosphatidylserine decarboxylase [Jeotgalibacillus proteolyticus]PPA69523.1 phosphatidylserine decarboxylase [Jeotgalibacillus proteolyticus]
MLTRFYRKVFELNGHPIVANTLRKFAQSSISKAFIPSFTRLYKLNLQEASREIHEYKSLHDLFTRELKTDIRPIANSPDAFISPCDSVLSVVNHLTTESIFLVKGQEYTVAELLGSKKAAEAYSGGQVLIFYLSPVDYHRVHVPIDAEVTDAYTLGKEAAPVNNLGLRYGLRPLTRNYRLVTNFKAAGYPFAHVMVGALNVNSIERTNTNRVVKRGDPYGYFSFGSTVVICVPKDAFSFTGKIGPVKMGEEIGKWQGVK